MILQKESQLKELLPLYCASLYVITSLQWVLCLFQWKRDFKLVSVCWVTREMHLLTETSIVFHMNYRSLVWAVFIFSVEQRGKKKLKKKKLIFFQFACPKTQKTSWNKRAFKHMPPCSGDHWSSTQAYWCYSESKVWICSASWIRFISAQQKLFQLTTAHVVISF